MAQLWYTAPKMHSTIQHVVCRAVEYDGMSSTMQANLATLNTILTWAFAGEVVLKVAVPLWLANDSLAAFVSRLIAFSQCWIHHIPVTTTTWL